MREIWKLTDLEIRAVEFLGKNMAEAQQAKRQAFIDNGGVILNPDALEDMYEALKHVEFYLALADQITSLPNHTTVSATIKKALAKAE